MKSSPFARYFFVICVGAALLAGCSGGPLLPAGTSNAAAYPDQSQSWMAPEAKKEDLLYVSDINTYDVYVYAYPKGKLVGTLTNQNNPAGLCVDKKGNIFVTQLYGGGHIVEYAHGGTTQLESLSDPGYEPGGCSVNFKTGTLAVSNIINDYFDVGDLLIYKDAKGSPKVIQAPPQSASGGVWGSVNTCGYDDKGNIFIAGHGYPDANVFGEVPKGASNMINITLNQDFGNGIGNVQWDGKHITFAGIDGSIYAFTMKGSQGTEVGSTILNGSNQVDQGWIQGSTVIAPQQYGAEVLYYKYPAGGNKTRAVSEASAPFGTTVSLAK
ncbi:MAG TPA: hypothetical protein VGI19_02095 [Candidatus Cybelea sp.]